MSGTRTKRREATTTDKARVRVIRVYLPDPELHTTRARGLGFQAVCDCTWKGHRTRNMREARAEMWWHRANVHGREQ